ncbi:MAG: hypothetical protein HQK77_20675 [Desulfobacterales bacterium]|nr:hypothetical protein [Desulfobacterales bacterium]
MTKIKLTGVKHQGKCEISTNQCIAKEHGNLTAVFNCENGSQINVCEPCLKANLIEKTWELDSY